MAGCVGTLGEESRVLPWCLLQEGDMQSHTEAPELVFALIHFGQSRSRNSFSFSIAMEPQRMPASGLQSSAEVIHLSLLEPGLQLINGCHLAKATPSIEGETGG